MGLLAALVLMLMAQAPSMPPRIQISKTPSHTILIDRIPEGALGACVVFKSEDELLDGVPWAARHCLWFEEPVSSFQDDWDFITPGHNYEIWAEIQTQLADGSGGPDYTTNHIHEAH